MMHFLTDLLGSLDTKTIMIEQHFGTQQEWLYLWVCYLSPSGVERKHTFLLRVESAVLCLWT